MSSVPPLLVLKARAEACALLVEADELKLDHALGALWGYALNSGLEEKIGGEQCLAVIRRAFEGVAEI